MSGVYFLKFLKVIFLLSPFGKLHHSLFCLSVYYRNYLKKRKRLIFLLLCLSGFSIVCYVLLQQLEFGVEPECLHFVPELSPVEGAMQTEQTVDSIRHIYLGKQPLVVKQCCR